MLAKIPWVQAAHPSPTHTGHIGFCSGFLTRKTILNECMLLFWLSLVHEYEQVRIFLANEGEPVAAVCMMVFSATIRLENGARSQQKNPNFMLGAICMDNGARQHKAERNTPLRS